MIRKVDLVSYLPQFMSEYKEIAKALEAENPEFEIAWDAANHVLQNEFISTADKYGIMRFEKMLDIAPLAEDDLEARRIRVQVRWLNKIPYTWKTFLEYLITLCGQSDFVVTTDFTQYKITLKLNLRLLDRIEEIKHMVETIIPSNMVVVIDFNYNTWNQVNALTWRVASNITWKQLKEDEI